MLAGEPIKGLTERGLDGGQINHGKQQLNLTSSRGFKILSVL